MVWMVDRYRIGACIQKARILGQTGSGLIYILFYQAPFLQIPFSESQDQNIQFPVSTQLTRNKFVLWRPKTLTVRHLVAI